MNKYLYFAATALLLAACTNDEALTTATDGEVALKVNAAISGISTRASGTNWATGDRIGLSTTSDTKTKYANVPFEYNGAAFIADGTDIYFQDTRTAVFSAYYPYTAEAGTVSKTITADDQTAENQPQIDYLSASGATASKASPTVNFTGEQAFNHCMSQVTLTFINGDDVELDGNLTSYTLGGLVMEGSFDTATGKAQATGTQPAALTIALTDVTTTEGAYTAAPLILFPQTAAQADISVTVDNEIYTATLIIPAGALQAGNNYTFPVTVSKTGLTVGSASINDWTDVQGNGTTATM